MVSGINTKKGKAEVTPYDLDKKNTFHSAPGDRYVWKQGNTAQ